MPTMHVQCAQQVILFITVCVVLMTVSTAGLCPDRCEQADPFLLQLKSLWARAYSSQSPDFDSFVQSVITATSASTRLRLLRSRMVRMMTDYRHCLMACEHSFSKRSYTYYKR